MSTTIFLIAVPLLVLLLTLRSRSLGVGALIILWPAYLVRTSFFGVPTTMLELSLYAGVLAVAGRALWRHDFPWPRLPRWLTVGTIVWILAWILSTIFSADRQASLGAFKAWLVDPLLFGWLILVTVTDQHSRGHVLRAAVVSGTIVALAGLIQLVAFRDTLQDNRLSSFFHPVANYAAMYLGPLLVITTGLILWRVLNRWWWIAVGIMAIALALTFSFGGYLAVTAGLAMFWMIWPNQRQRRLALAVGVVVAIISTLALARTPYLAEKFRTSDRSSSLVRTQIWRTSWEMITERPIVGVGPNAFEPIYRQTVPKLYWPPLEWLVAQPHNLYLALWLETGLLGLAIFLYLIGRWLRWLWPAVRQRQPLALAAVAGMASTLIHGLVDTPLFKNDLALLLVFIILLPWLADHQSHTTSTDQIDGEGEESTTNPAPNGAG